MTPLGFILDRALQVTEWTLGTPTITIRGLAYPCTKSTLLRGTTLEIGGKTLEVRFTAVIRKSAMPLSSQSADSGALYDVDTPTADQDIIPPAAGDRVTVDQIDYRIGSVEEDAAGASWKLHLVSPDR